MSSANDDAAAQYAARGARALEQGDGAVAARMLAKAVALSSNPSAALRHKLEEAQALQAASGSPEPASEQRGAGAGAFAAAEPPASPPASPAVDSEANRDAAQLLAERGARALGEGDAPGAVKLLSRALRMCSTLGPEVRGQLQAAEQAMSARASAAGGRPTAAAAADGTRRRAAAAAAPAEPTFTPEMAETVRKVRSAKDHFAVLGVERDADEHAIGRAYKKLALRVHPDKNTAPGADEAFKRVGKAYATLTDANERANYERYGEAGANVGGGGGGVGGGGGGGHPFHQQRRGHEPTPEDIFNAVFGAGFGGLHGAHIYRMHQQQQQQQRGGTPQQRYQQQQQQQRRGGEDDDPRMGGVQISNALPLIMVLVFFVLSLFGGGSDDRWYSLVRTSAFSVSRVTGSRWDSVVPGLPYYVRDTVNMRLRTDEKILYEVELNVQADLKRAWGQACREETEQKRTIQIYMERSPSAMDRRRYKQRLDEIKTPNCDAFEQFFSPKKGRLESDEF